MINQLIFIDIPGDKDINIELFKPVFCNFSPI